MPRIALMVRRSLSFLNNVTIDPSLILTNDEKIAKVNWGIDWWGKTYKFEYREFRLRLRALAAELHQSNNFDDIIQWQDKETVLALPAGTWLIPVDEDDWLSPDLVNKLRYYCDQTEDNILAWNVIRKWANGVTQLNPNYFVESCGYIVRLPFEWEKIRSHMLLHPIERTIPEILSVRNETPASMAFLYKNPISSYCPALLSALSDSGDLIPSVFKPTWAKYRDLLIELSASIR